MGREEDRGFDYDEPIVDELGENMHKFRRAYRVVRSVEFILAAMTLGVVIYGWRSESQAATIGFVIIALFVCATIDIAKSALRLAMETEEERHEEMENYRRLSEELCLREHRKGFRDGDPAGREGAKRDP